MLTDLAPVLVVIALATAGLVAFVVACNRQNYIEPEAERRARHAAMSRHPAGQREGAGR